MDPLDRAQEPLDPEPEGLGLLVVGQTQTDLDRLARRRSVVGRGHDHAPDRGRAGLLEGSLHLALSRVEEPLGVLLVVAHHEGDLNQIRGHDQHVVGAPSRPDRRHEVLDLAPIDQVLELVLNEHRDLTRLLEGRALGELSGDRVDLKVRGKELYGDPRGEPRRESHEQDRAHDHDHRPTDQASIQLRHPVSHPQHGVARPGGHGQRCVTCQRCATCQQCVTRRHRRPLAHDRGRFLRRRLAGGNRSRPRPPLQIVHREDQKALGQRGGQGHSHRLGDDREVLAHDSVHEQHGEEGAHGGQGRADHGPDHLGRPEHDRVVDPEPLLDPLVDRLQDHDRVVDDHPRDEDQAEQADRVDREPQRLEQGQGHEHRERDPEEREQRVADPERQPQDQPDQDHAPDQVVDEHSDPAANDLARVHDQVDRDPLGELVGLAGLELVELNLEPLDEVDRVGGPLLDHREHQRRAPVEALVDEGLFEPEPDLGHVAEADRTPRPALEQDQVLEGRRVLLAAAGVEHELAPAQVELASREVAVQEPEPVGDLRQGQAQGPELLLADLDLDLGVAEGLADFLDPVDLTQARDQGATDLTGLKLLLDPEHLAGLSSRDNDLAQRPQLPGRERRDHGPLGVGREVVEARDRCAHVVEAIGELIGGEPLGELDVDQRAGPCAPAADLDHVLEREQLVFDLLCDEELDLLGRGAWPHRGDRGLVEGHVRIDVDRDLPIGEHTAHEQEHEQQVEEDSLAQDRPQEADHSPSRLGAQVTPPAEARLLLVARRRRLLLARLLFAGRRRLLFAGRRRLLASGRHRVRSSGGGGRRLLGRHRSLEAQLQG